MHYSTTLRNAQLAAIEATIGTAPKVRIYSGTVPANVAASLGAAVLLAEGDLPSDWLAAPSSAVVAKNGTWTLTGQSGAGTGTVGTFFRICASDGSTYHIQGTFSVTGGGGEMTADNASIANAQTITVNTYQVTGGNA